MSNNANLSDACRLRASLATTPPQSLVSKIGRSALTGRIVEGLDGQLVLLRAPAGYAKTEAMVAAFRVLEERGARCIWLTLAPGSTAEAIAGTIGQLLDLPAAARPEALVEALAKVPNGPIHLFLDEAEHVAAAPEALAWLLQPLPVTLRLAVSGRVLPQMRLSRLRVQGLLTELQAHDLAFGRNEIQQLLGQKLASSEIARLADVLAGWPALVRLAAIVLDGDATPADRAALLQGSHPVLREFVLEEVLPSLEDFERAVMDACLDLQNFPLDIAADLAGLANEYGILRQLETLAPLIFPEDQLPSWYRLHPVISQTLSYLSTETAEARRARHVRAAALFLERGFLEKSVFHASLAGDYELVVRTIEQAGGVDLFLRAGFTVLQRILQILPYEVLLKTPSLRLCRGVVLAKTGKIHEARAVINALITDTKSKVVPATESWDAALEHFSSFLDVYEDVALEDEQIAWLEHAAGSERQENTWRLGWIFNQLTIAHTRRGDLEAAQVNALKALACYQEERSSYPQVFMLIHLGFVNLHANRLEQSLSYCRQAESMIRARHWNDENLLAIAKVPIARISYLQGDLAQALQALEWAMPMLARGEGWVDFFVQGYATLARSRMAAADWSLAQEALQDGLAVADSRGLSRLRLSLSILRVEFLTRTGQVEPAKTIANQLPDPYDLAAWATNRERREAILAVGRLALRDGDAPRASEMLDALAQECRYAKQEEVLLLVNLVRCEAHWRQGAVVAAYEALEEAAQLSLSGLQSRQFLDEGPGLADAVRSLVRRVGLSRISRTLTDYLARTAKSSAQNVQSPSLLSAREAEVLSLLAEGLTSKGIARRLAISEPTVKFHLKNLYSKLGVSRRALAVQVAQARDLL